MLIQKGAWKVSKKEKKISIRESVREFIHDEYDVQPEHLWKSYPTYEVFRHEENEKWFAIIMDVKRDKLGLPGDGFIDILDIKLDPVVVSMMCGQKGYLPAYHMNKKYWLTVLLDGSVPLENVLNLLDQSFVNTAGKGNKKVAVRSGPKDWLIPSNPKYYDVITAFKEEEVIEWKQSSDVRVGDIVYLYVGAPYSAILYKCKAVEVNIPYHYETEYLTIKKVMKIQLLHTYDRDFMPFSRLKEEFGVYAVRGPRGVPNSLKVELDMYADT